MLIIPLISSSVLILPVRTITIKPESHPEIYFFSSAGTIPNDEDFLKECAENDIGFLVSLKRDYIDVNGTIAESKIIKLIKQNVNIYVVLGGDDDDYYATTRNGDEFYKLFKYVRNWLANLKTNDSIYPLVYNHPSFKGFLMDAEPNIDDLEDKGYIDRFQYFLDDIPNEERLEEIEKELKKLIDEAHDDNKEVGLIKPLSTFDELDGDHDYSDLTEQFYSLDLDWDLRISMLYRTRYKPDMWDYLMFNMKDYYVSERSLGNYELEEEILPLPNFYTKVAMELESDEVDVPKDKRYIFIGTFHKEFKDTDYIDKGGYLNDIDILRHFDLDKVFIFDWDNWKERYDGDLENLIENLNQDDEWELTLPNYVISREIFVMIFIIYLDRTLFLQVC